MTDFLANAEKIGELEKLFVQHERFDPLMRTFRTLLYKRVSDIQSSKVRELHGIALSGGSGAEKTRTIEKLIEKTEQDPIIAEQFPKAVVSVKIPSPPKLKLLGIRTLRALGFKLTSERQAWYIWDLVHHQLREQKVLFFALRRSPGFEKERLRL